MARQILTCTLDRERLKAELAEVVQYFGEKGVGSCRVLFGFAWGNEYYPGSDWNEEEIELAQLCQKVGEAEERGLGTLGKDDLFVKLAGLEFKFCHECDVHIHFAEPNNTDVETFFARWQKIGYEPFECVPPQELGSDERAR